MSTRWGLLAVVSGIVAVTGCGSMTTSSAESGGYNAGTPSGASPADPAAPPANAGEIPDGPAPAPAPQAGQLTAGVWDDNLNFAFFSRYAKVMGSRLQGVPFFSDAERFAARDRALRPRAQGQALDLAIVFDTTGSMGDELRYLQSEFEAIVSSLKAKYPSVSQRYSLVVYRDQGDQYVTKSSPFVSDVSEFRATMAKERAGGGGDFPEAVDEALEHMTQLDWDASAGTARVAFWVADAPHHVGAEARVAAATKAAAAKDVHVYPVAASGTDDRTEYTMRSVAQMTGGRYLFLTDDSGIGNAHAEPRIPCYFVTRLDHAIERMLDIELRGARLDPPKDQIVRTVGTPVNGFCSVRGEQLACY